MIADINLYLSWKAQRHSPAAERYAVYLFRFNDFCGRGVGQISISDVMAFQTHLEQTSFKDSTVSFAITAVRNFVSFCWLNRKTDLNPALINPPIYERPPVHFVTEEEFNRMYAVWSEWEFGQLAKKLTLAIFWDTGIRVSELCNLNISQLDTNKRSTVICTLKSRKKRTRVIKWSEETHNLLIKYLGVRICLNANDALFIATSNSKRRERVTTRTVQRWIALTGQKAGIGRNVHPHELRHGKVHLARTKGADLIAINAILGHSKENLAGSMRYIDLDYDEQEELLTKYI